MWSWSHFLEVYQYAHGEHCSFIPPVLLCFMYPNDTIYQALTAPFPPQHIMNYCRLHAWLATIYTMVYRYFKCVWNTIHFSTITLCNKYNYNCAAGLFAYCTRQGIYVHLMPTYMKMNHWLSFGVWPGKYDAKTVLIRCHALHCQLAVIQCLQFYWYLIWQPQ